MEILGTQPILKWVTFNKHFTAGQSLNLITQHQKQGISTQKETLLSQPNFLAGLSQTCF